VRWSDLAPAQRLKRGVHEAHDRAAARERERVGDQLQVVAVPSPAAVLEPEVGGGEHRGAGLLGEGRANEVHPVGVVGEHDPGDRQAQHLRVRHKRHARSRHLHGGARSEHRRVGIHQEVRASVE
jgi:hypothetical protein